MTLWESFKLKVREVWALVGGMYDQGYADGQETAKRLRRKKDERNRKEV